jgi:hypothetical protein
MRQLMMTMTALAAFGAMVATSQAENQTPSPPIVSGPLKKRSVSQTQSEPPTPPSPANLGWDYAHPGGIGGFQPTAGHMHWVEIGMHQQSDALF